MKLVTVLLFIMAAVTPLGLYFMKNEVRQMEQNIAGLNAQLTEDQESIRVLRAEWAYLNQPARLDELSNRFLGLQPIVTDQIMAADDLPYRRLELVRFPDVGTRSSTPLSTPSSIGFSARRTSFVR